MRLSGNASSTTNCADSSDLLNLALGYGASNTNNGNVMSQTITMPKQAGGALTLAETYGYDGVNRLASVAEAVTAGGSGGGAWSFAHSYDRFGNMWVSGNTGLTLHVTTPTQQSQFNTATNRLTGTGVTYDAVGNLTAYPLLGTMGYDAENRQTQFTSGSTTVNYHYDGAGRRVKQVKGSETTVFVYDAFGNLAADYSTAQASGTAGRYYRTTDHLGSTRLVTSSTGAVVSRHDFGPFGEELAASSSAGNRNLVQGFGNSSFRQKFTGKERDLDSGLDYFLARYYASPMGRFTSADAPFADQHGSNPQSWNLFGYVRNNPLKFVDENGRELKLAIFNSSSQSQRTVERAGQRIATLYRDAGVKNVSVEVTNHAPGSLDRLGALAAASKGLLGLGQHSATLEFRDSAESTGGFMTGQSIPPGNAGHFRDGQALVNVSALPVANTDPNFVGPPDAAVALSNVGAHEVAHNALQGHATGESDPTNIMFPKATAPVINRSDLRFNESQAKVLRDRFNRENEVEDK